MKARRVYYKLQQNKTSEVDRYLILCFYTTAVVEKISI